MIFFLYKNTLATYIRLIFLQWTAAFIASCPEVRDEPSKGFAVETEDCKSVMTKYPAAKMTYVLSTNLFSTEAVSVTFNIV